MSSAKPLATLATFCALGLFSFGTYAMADSRIDDIVQAGEVRIGVFPSFQYSKDSTTGQPQGLAVRIAQALAAHLGLTGVATIEHPTPPNVLQCVKSGDCHFGFMLIDPARATEVDFTPAFVRSDFTYLVPAVSKLRSARDVDSTGTRIAVVRGHASTAALLRIVMQAELVYTESYDSAVDLLRDGKADAFASIREMLLQYAPRLSQARVLEDSYLSNLAGVAVSKGHAGRLTYMSEFLDDMKRSGTLQHLIDTLGLRGIEIVPPAESAGRFNQ